MKKYFSAVAFIVLISMTGCIKEDYFGKSSLKEIISFQMPQQIGDEVIDEDSMIIRVIVSEDLDITNLAPAEFTISNFATLSPSLQDSQDFSAPVVYTITAEDGSSVAYTIVLDTDEPRIQLANSGFDQWYMTSGGYMEIGPDENSAIWATGNAGVVTLGSANNLPLLLNSDTVAQLTTVDLGPVAQITGQRVAAGSLFAGYFDLNIVNPSASANFGTPFIGRPDSFSIQYQYTPGAQMKNGQGHNIPGNDSLDIAVLLEDRSGATVKRVATAWFRSDVATSGMTELKLPLVYGELTSPAYYEVPDGSDWGDGTEKPTHISVIISSSARGAIFEGAPGSELLVNDLKFYYN